MKTKSQTSCNFMHATAVISRALVNNTMSAGKKCEHGQIFKIIHRFLANEKMIRCAMNNNI